MKIEGISAFVTGGASGLGAATTRLLVERGARVAFYDLPRSNGGELEKELSGSARFLPGDVTDESGVDAALEAAADAFGPLRAVVNCAGIGSAQRTVGREGQPFPLENFRRTVEVNLIGTFNVIRLAAKRMVGNEPNADGERGAIVNTASVAAFEGQIGQAAYSASKGGVVGMTLPIARDLARHGIRVSSWACPSPPCRPWARASRSRRAWESRPSTPRSPARSSRTPCSTARRSASTGRSAWRRSSRR
jgi:NAD(P)-dependent dehydrogenase (short-subunit alcohol dehydrogenase family)